MNFISGLGADERVFQSLKLINVEKNYVKWIEPFKNETIENYAQRLSVQIDTSKINILLCVSFGGLIGIELSKIIQFEKIIIISSVKNKYEIPYYYRIAGKLKLYKPIPGSLLKTYNFIISFFFGITNEREKDLLKNILNDTNSIFLKWAISKITNWNNRDNIKNIYHIHGSKDRLFPIRCIKDFIKIIDGHHFMVITKSDELSEKINEIINL